MTESHGAIAPAHLWRGLLYTVLIVFALYYLLPLFVMLVNSVKPLDEIRGGNMLALPVVFTLEPWSKAWATAQIGVDPTGLKPYFWNTVQMVVPAVAISTLLGALNGIVLLYPRPTSGFHVKGGLGLMRFEITDGDDADDTARVTSLGLQLGVGYDLRVSPGYSITPFMNFVASSYGNLEQDNEILAEQVNVTLIQFGLGLSAH